MHRFPSSRKFLLLVLSQSRQFCFQIFIKLATFYSEQHFSNNHCYQAYKCAFTFGCFQIETDITLCPTASPRLLSLIQNLYSATSQLKIMSIFSQWWHPNFQIKPAYHPNNQSRSETSV